MNIVDHEIPLNGVESTDLGGIKSLIEANSKIFKNYLLAGYSGDASYSVVEDTFEITSIESGFFEYTVFIDFFAGCKGMNESDPKSYNSEFDIKDGKIIISLNETIWNVGD